MSWADFIANNPELIKTAKDVGTQFAKSYASGAGAQLGRQSFQGGGGGRGYYPSPYGYQPPSRFISVAGDRRVAEEGMRLPGRDRKGMLGGGGGEGRKRIFGGGRERRGKGDRKGLGKNLLKGALLGPLALLGRGKKGKGGNKDRKFRLLKRGDQQ
jgi:hypothetical protein